MCYRYVHRHVLCCAHVLLAEGVGQTLALLEVPGWGVDWTGQFLCKMHNSELFHFLNLYFLLVNMAM